MSVIAENQLRRAGAEVYRPNSVAIALPCEYAGRPRRQRALAAQLVRIQRKKGLDSALSRAVMSPGTATAHSHHRFFEILLRIMGDAFADQPIAAFVTAVVVRQT